MKTIPLSQGRFALVDDEDYEWLSQHKWFAVCAKGRNGVNGDIWYATRNGRIGKKWVTVRMHREIAARLGFPPLDVDHRDTNGLNNQRLNLRPSTKSQNAMNQRKSINRSSRFKGVAWHKGHKKWQAQIQINGKLRHLGTFVDEEKAAAAYASAAKSLFGDFARV